MIKSVKLIDVISDKITGEWGKEGGSVKVLRTTNFTNSGIIDYNDVVSRDIDQKVINKKKLKPGDVIIEKSGGGPKQPVGRVVYFNHDDCFLCNNFTTILRPNEEVYSKYLFYFLHQSHHIGITQKFQNKTTGIINLKLDKYLAKVEIPLPPLSEQKHIANILDKADELVKKNKALLQEYNDLQQAIFLDMFGDPVTNPKGWEMKRLLDVVEKVQIGPFGSQLHKSDYQISGIPLVNPTNIINGEIDLENAMKITEEKYNSLPQYHLTKNDIIMARRGDLSKVSIIEDKGNKLFCGTGSLYIRLNRDINPYFVLNVLSHERTTKLLESEARGVTMPNLNKSIINSIQIYNPPLEIQNKYSAINENIEHQKEKVQESLTYSEELFEALVSAYFRNSAD